MKLKLQKGQFFASLALTVLGLCACESPRPTFTISVTNSLDFPRKEVVSIQRESLAGFLGERSEEGVLLKEKGKESYQVIQWLDGDLDGKSDQLLFQAQVAPHTTRQYELVWQEGAVQPEPRITTYSRFVPERTDDYTWENDKVAFRTYGPGAQRLKEDGEPDGTLSSGIDLWLKKVDYSIIDAWYAANDKEPGYYHIDHGEGYDPYHVGKSRGTGGIGVWVGDSLQVSKNFVGHKIIATGPLRTVFELDYAPWSEFGIRETKRISLDLGSNFSKFEISLTSEIPVPNYAIGITLHDGKGEVQMDMERGFFSHWEPMDGSFLGEGIVIDPSVVKEAFANTSHTPDQSQLLVLTHPFQKKLVYHVGFGWTKSNQIGRKEGWEALLALQTKIVANPLEVTVNE